MNGSLAPTSPKKSFAKVLSDEEVMHSLMRSNIYPKLCAHKTYPSPAGTPDIVTESKLGYE